MKKEWISTFIIIILCLPAMATKSHDSLKIYPELNGFIKRYVVATNSHDFSQVHPLLIQGAVYWFNGEESKGALAIRASFEKSWRYLPDEVYGIEKVEWLLVTSNSATCRYVYTFRGTHEGTQVEGSGFGTSVLVKQNGMWLIAHEHLSR
ncbi:MAG TPA: nuclear transport factor 2 family protein [Flavisolibacter sp.]|nr:nuclear transport factor 2 family protein [Flavisolibacter sp.]